MIATVRLITSVVVIAILFATACGSKTHSGAASSEAAKAKVTAAAADTQLTKDGYSALHVPGFGKVDLGIRSAAPKYEAVYIAAGKDPAVVKNLVTNVQKKLAGNKAVTVKQVGNLVVAQAATLGDLKTAAKAIIQSAK